MTSDERKGIIGTLLFWVGFFISLLSLGLAEEHVHWWLLGCEFGILLIFCAAAITPHYDF